MEDDSDGEIGRVSMVGVVEFSGVVVANPADGLLVGL